MPIYSYRCEACGFAKDALQKVSDAPLTECPSCSQSTFKKQLTAAGFQLKGSGWYATDFRGGSGGTAKPTANNADPAAASSTNTGVADSGSSTAPETSSGTASGTSGTAPASGS
jgi:putative FmdB family regulatory protein